MDREAKLLLNHAKTLRLHTGNLVSRSRLKKKCPSSPSEELQDCIQATLTDWLSSTKPPPEDLPDTLDCSIPQETDAIPPEEREELKVSVKLFLCEPVQSSIGDAVEMACQTLGVSQLDSVIIAPPGSREGDSQSLADLQPAWEALEALVRNQQIAAIGTSDLDKDLLEQLYNWADMPHRVRYSDALALFCLNQVKPSSNQVNLASCCVMPPDLTAFAKEFDIQLLTHNDPKELISAATFQEAVQEGTQNAVADDWRLEWVLRYSIIVKSRGIIKAKGYLISPPTGRTSRRPLKQAESQCTHLEKGETEHQASPPASTVKRCSRASRLHSPEQAATPVGSTRDPDVSDVESLCSVISDMETPLTRSRRRAKPPCRVYQADEELSEVESCSSAVSAASPGRKTRQSARRKTISRSSDAGAVKMDLAQDSCSSTVSTSSRITRSQRKAAPTRLPTKHTDDSELSDPDSCLSSVSGADVPNSSTRTAARPRRQTGPIPVNIDKAGDRTSLTLTPVRQSSRVAARRKTQVAVEVSAPQSCDSEGFESGPTCLRENRRRRVARTLDSDSDLTDLTPVVCRLLVKNIGGTEKSVEPAEDTSLQDSSLENTVIAEDAECTLLDEEIEQDPKSDRVDVTEETKAERAAVVARRQQEELCEDQKDTSELEKMQERAARVTDRDPFQGDKDGVAADPHLCEGEEEMEAGPVDGDNQQVVECFQVASSKDQYTKVDSLSEDEPEDITVHKRKVISLLDSSEDEEEDEESEVSEAEEESEVSEAEEERGAPSSKPGAADMAVDGLFMIDTRPGQEADGQYYMEEVAEKEKKATEDKAEQEEEEEFVDEEVNDDDNDDTDLLYSSRNPLLKEMSSRIDPGIRIKELGGLYINFDGGKSKAVSGSLAKLKEKKAQDEVMKKSVIGADFEKKDAVPPYQESKQALKLKRRVEKEKTTGDSWFNMKAPELSQELKGDLQVLKMRGSLDSKRFYKKNDRDGFPKYFQVGTVVDNPVDFYHSRIPKKNRKRTMVEEL
ncbi:unnamed protein product, partial [Tetraodon nigroviridis]